MNDLVKLIIIAIERLDLEVFKAKALNRKLGTNIKINSAEQFIANVKIWTKTAVQDKDEGELLNLGYKVLRRAVELNNTINKRVRNL